MPKFNANLTMLFNEVPFLDRFQAAAEAGFKGVEFLFPYAFDKDAIADRLVKHGLVQVLHNLPAGNWDAGERGIACHPDRVGEFQDGVGRAIEYATALGCRQLNCLAGIAPAGVDTAKVHRDLRRQPALRRQPSSRRPASACWSSRSTPSTSRASTSTAPRRRSR